MTSERLDRHGEGGSWMPPYLSQPFMVRFSKFLCLVKACENRHWFLFHNQLPIVHRLAATRRRSDEGQSRQFFRAKNPKFSIFSYKHVMYLKWKLKLSRIQIHKEKNKIWLWKMIKKSIFLIFDSKMRLTRNLREPVSKTFYQQISKMTLSGSGRSFNLKSHQRRALHLCSFGIGGRSPEQWAIVTPPSRPW